jgi:hypothetical protein
MRSIQFMEKIERIVQQTRRDLSRVDWRKEVPEELSAALKHVDSRIKIEQHIAHTARDRLDHLEPGSHEALGVAQVAELMDDCFDRHTRLHHTLLQARSVFFIEQSRQRFTPSPTEALPNLFAQVLEPLLSAGVPQTLEVLGWGVDRPAGAVAALLGPHAPGVFSLEHLISGLLRPRREAPVYSSVEQKLEWHLSVVEQPRFPEEIKRAAQSHLDIQSVRLSELLEVAANESNVLLEFLGLHGVQAFGSEPGFGWSAEKLNGPFRIAGFYGDDLLLSALESARTDDEPIQGVT